VADDYLADQLVASYEQAFQAETAGGEKIYGDSADWSAMTWAAHNRRIELLAGLPVGELTGKTVVDYGCGPWGFAAVYPRLHHCGFAIGIDISPAAVRASEVKTAAGNYPFGKNYKFITSRGDTIDLPTASVDLFFGGESIEHVENTDAFLDEVHRLLKPGGLCVLTTPNADAYLYRLRGEKYCIGPEHVALMSYDELLSYFLPRFHLLKGVGFNGGVYGSWDGQVRDQEFAERWAALFEDRPDLATGQILLGRRRDDYAAAAYRTERFHHSHPAVRYAGAWKEMSLARALTARGSGGGAAVAVPFTGTGLIVHLWCHDWSGIAEVRVGQETRTVNLYSPGGGFTRVVFRGLDPGREHTLTVRGAGKDPRSHGDEVLFYQAIATERLTAAGRLAA
jgi:SAM-dependent methyltransferase